MKIAVASGKGGTGKTTIASAFASLAKNAVLADCDVDAPDLQLILKPDIESEKDYFGSRTARKIKKCSMCGRCREVCRFKAVDENFEIDEVRCEGCGACAYICPEDAIEMKEMKTGKVFVSKTRFGPMIHAELEIGEEASGKMVTRVRNRARELSEGKDFLIVDGSPGIGCPVIASIKGADYVLIVVEPTVSGIHDLKRVLEVADHFGIGASVCVNKYDINESKTEEIEKFCEEKSVPVVGKLPYDDIATKAMMEEKSVIEYSDSELSREIRSIWDNIKGAIGS